MAAEMYGILYSLKRVALQSVVGRSRYCCGWEVRPKQALDCLIKLVDHPTPFLSASISVFKIVALIALFAFFS